MTAGAAGGPGLTARFDRTHEETWHGWAARCRRSAAAARAWADLAPAAAREALVAELEAAGAAVFVEADVSQAAGLGSVVNELAPRMQVIVSDHANLVEQDWFQDAIEHYWRGGNRLVPTAWLEEIEIEQESSPFDED